MENLLIKGRTTFKLNDEGNAEQCINSEVLTKENLLKRALESEEDYQNGKFLSQGEFEQKSLNW